MTRVALPACIIHSEYILSTYIYEVAQAIHKFIQELNDCFVFFIFEVVDTVVRLLTDIK